MKTQTKKIIDPAVAEKIARKFSTPCYVYDEAALARQAKAALAFPNAFGLTVRYAMKAASNAAILRLFNSLGLHIDASSGFEAMRAIRAGIKPCHISLSSQQLPKNLAELVRLGVLFNACSIHQLECFGKIARGAEVGVRINPGLGSGGTNRTNVGGPASSFGIWRDYIPEILSTAKKTRLKSCESTRTSDRAPTRSYGRKSRR